MEKAWLMLDAANEKEQRGRETIETLKVEIDNLTKVPFNLNFSRNYLDRQKLKIIKNL